MGRLERLINTEFQQHYLYKLLKFKWCERGDLNPYPFRDWILRAKNLIFKPLDIGPVFP